MSAFTQLQVIHLQKQVEELEDEVAKLRNDLTAVTLERDLLKAQVKKLGGCL